MIEAAPELQTLNNPIADVDDNGEREGGREKRGERQLLEDGDKSTAQLWNGQSKRWRIMIRFRTLFTHYLFSFPWNFIFLTL